jgi:hypothetical protein
MFKKLMYASMFLSSASYAGLVCADIVFEQGDIYTTHYNDNIVSQYDVEGNFKGSLTVEGVNTIRGIAYYNNLLYAAVNGGWSDDLSVIAFDESGAIVEEYRSVGRVAGNISYGKIAIDDNAGIFVGQGNDLMHFVVGESESAESLYGEGIFDVKTLSNGTIIVATSYNILFMDSQGNILRELTVSDPDELTGSSLFRLTDIRGIEYDEKSDVLFVSMLGHTGLQFPILKINGTTGELINFETYNYADDLQLLEDGRLLAGSRTRTPNLYSSELDAPITLGSESKMFVTQIPVDDEPDVISVNIDITNDWSSGYCANLVVTNNSGSPQEWLVSIDIEGSIFNLWNGEWSQEGPTLEVKGVSWNSTIQPDQTINSVGFCAGR